MASRLSADEIIALLGLLPHPAEGGYFVETYRAEERVEPGALPGRYAVARRLSTAIYFFLTPDTFSAMHRLRSDEIFHFYLGDPVELLQLRPDGDGDVTVLGPDLGTGMRPQVVVQHGVWQGLKLRAGGELALLGTTVAPGFNDADFELGQRDALTRQFPRFAARIASLTRP